jgi:hypothetical protein
MYSNTPSYNGTSGRYSTNCGTFIPGTAMLGPHADERHEYGKYQSAESRAVFVLSFPPDGFLGIQEKSLKACTGTSGL